MSGPSNRSAAVGPSSPKGSTMNGLSWYLRFRHSVIISDPCVLLAWVRFGPRNFSSSMELKCLKTSGVMRCEHTWGGSCDDGWWADL